MRRRHVIDALRALSVAVSKYALPLGLESVYEPWKPVALKLP